MYTSQRQQTMTDQARREYAALLCLGRAWERASQDRDYARLVLVEAAINAIAEDILRREAGVPQMVVIRGRNIVRRAEGLDLIHV